MENQNHNFDENFRQRLHGAEVPPPPFVWSAVEHELHKRRRRRLLFVWLFTFGTVLAGVWMWEAILHTRVNQVQHLAPSADMPKINPAGNQRSSAESSPVHSNDFAAQEQTISKVTRVKLPNRNTANLKKTSLKPEDGVEESNTATSFVISESESVKTQAIAIADNQLTINGLPSVVSLSNNKEIISPAEFRSNSRKKKSPPKLCYDFARHPTAWLLDVYAGPSLAQRSLTSALDDEPYLNQRLATENRSVAMNAGIRASLMFNRNILVRTGLHYDQVTEVFEYIDPTFVITSVNQIFINGQFVGVDTVVSYGENYLKTYNRYATLDIPLLVGVEMRQGRTGLSINAGISANVLFHKRGAIIDPVTHEPARFGAVPDAPDAVGPKTSLSQEAFRTNVGLSATASIQWYWHLSPHWRLFAEPSFRQVLRPITLNSHPVEQRYSIIGLRLGATKIF